MSFISTSAAIIYIKFYSFIPIYILKVFIEGFVYIIHLLLVLHVIYMHLQISCRFLKMSFISSSAALTCTKTYSSIPIYILKVFIEGFVDIINIGFIITLYRFVSVDFSYNSYL